MSRKVLLRFTDSSWNHMASVCVRSKVWPRRNHSVLSSSALFVTSLRRRKIVETCTVTNKIWMTFADGGGIFFCFFHLEKPLGMEQSCTYSSYHCSSFWYIPFACMLRICSECVIAMSFLRNAEPKRDVSHTWAFVCTVSWRNEQDPSFPLWFIGFMLFYRLIPLALVGSRPKWWSHRGSALRAFPYTIAFLAAAWRQRRPRNCWNPEREGFPLGWQLKGRTTSKLPINIFSPLRMSVCLVVQGKKLKSANNSFFSPPHTRGDVPGRFQLSAIVRIVLSSSEKRRGHERNFQISLFHYVQFTF